MVDEIFMRFADGRTDIPVCPTRAGGNVSYKGTDRNVCPTKNAIAKAWLP